MAAGQGTVTIKILGDPSNLKVAVSDAEGAMGKLGDSSSKAGAKLKKMSTGVALGLGALGGAALNMAAGYEQSMDVLQATTQASGKEMDKLGDLAMKLGADVKLPGTSAKDAADSMLELSKAGLTLKDTMAATKGVLQLSAAAGIENAEAAEIAANALNAFGLSGKKAADVANQLAATANASSVEVQDVAASFKMAAAVFSAVQAPAVGAERAMKDLNTAIGILGNMGIKGSDAGTSLKQMLLQLTGPSEKAKDAMKALYMAGMDASIGSDMLTKALGNVDDRGTALRVMAQATNSDLMTMGDIAYNSAGQMRSLTEIIDLVTAGTAKMTQEQKNAYITQIFGADASRAVIALMKEGTEGWDEMSEAVGRGSAAADMAAAKNKGLKGALDALQSTGETFLLKVALPLVPTFTTIIQKVSGLIDGFSKLSPGIQVAVFAGVALLAVIGPMITVIGTLTTVVTGLGAVLMFLAANPVVLIIAAIAALVAGLVLAYKNCETFRNIVDTAFRAVATAAVFMKDVVVNALQFQIDLWLAYAEWVTKAAAKAFGWVPGIGGKLKEAAKAVEGFRDQVNTALDSIKSKSVTVEMTTVNRVVNIVEDVKPGQVPQRMPARAAGGPVTAGMPYWTGERGPEPFIPAVSGRILSHEDAMAAMSGRGGGSSTPVYVTLPGRGQMIDPHDLEAALLRLNQVRGPIAFKTRS
jgi:TP901 family phage tail tape measure protein